MFEYDQEIVSSLLELDEHFQELYKHHAALKTQVYEAEIGLHPRDDLSLGRLKRQKLFAKDKMAHIIHDYRREHA